MIDALDAASSSSSAVDAFVRLLATHVSAEHALAAVIPVFASAEHEEEHAMFAFLATRARGVASRRRASLRVLRRYLEHYFDAEERMLEVVEASLPRETLAALGAAFREACRGVMPRALST